MAAQFFWKLDRGASRRTFRWSSGRATDVNHGFAIYKGTKFVAQEQVMPGKTQKLVHTCSEAGTYEILCLEF
jgi:heme/copper-type cytochrome/quinol oxidase subunit 2